MFEKVFHVIHKMSIVLLRFIIKPVIFFKLIPFVTLFGLFCYWCTAESGTKDFLIERYEKILYLFTVPFTILFLLVFIFCYVFSWGPLDSIILTHEMYAIFLISLTGAIIFKNAVKSRQYVVGISVASLIWFSGVMLILDLLYLYKYSLLVKYTFDIVINRARRLSRPRRQHFMEAT